MINIIAGVTENYCLGKDNDLVVKNKEDLNLFKQLTLGKVVIMGRKTWDSLPIKPLPGRLNIVITRTQPENPPKEVLFCTVDEFLKEWFFKKQDYWLIGGSEIYKIFLELNLVDSIYLSRFAEQITGDTYFPKEYLELFTKKYIKHFKTFKQEIYVKPDQG